MNKNRFLPIGWGLALAVAGLAASPPLQIATKGNELAFDPPKLHAKAGQAVQLTFTNRADKQSGMKHTWVLTKPGKQDDVVAKAAQAGEAKGYLADSPDIIAHTRLLAPGESQTIHFKAPTAPGDYPFFCTFPGHASQLKGTLEVAP
jgi:azurin